jgi:hypothetical protein
MKCGRFNVRKWNAGSSELLPNESVDANRISFNKKNHFKVWHLIDVSWHLIDDSFRFKVTTDIAVKFTKRSILSCVAKLYDPIGWAAPIIVVAKILLQELWFAQLDWDDPLLTDLNKQWIRYYEQMSHLASI